MQCSAEVLRAGVLTTVQDEGRPGWQRYGVAVGGAVDGVALAAANLLVGNARGAAALECTLQGPSLRFDGEALLAVCGFDPQIVVDGQSVPAWRPVYCPAGAVVDVSTSQRGCRAYLAIGGGVSVSPVLGSRSTYLYGEFGGLAGRPLQIGDKLAVDMPSAMSMHRLRVLRASVDGGLAYPSFAEGPSLRPEYSTSVVVRYLPGPDADRLDDAGRQSLTNTVYRLTPDSNRMGARLSGPPLPLSAAPEPLSKPITQGTIQVTPDGQLTVLIADHQTVGGYPNIGQVIAVDMPRVAQLRPGDAIRFEATDLATAHLEWRRRQEALTVFEHALRLRDLQTETWIRYRQRVPHARRAAADERVGLG